MGFRKQAVCVGTHTPWSLCLTWCPRRRVCEQDDPAQSTESGAGRLGRGCTHPLEVPSGCRCPHGHPTFEARQCGRQQTPRSTWIPSRESSVANQLPDLRKLLQHFRTSASLWANRTFRDALKASSSWEFSNTEVKTWDSFPWRGWRGG